MASEAFRKRVLSDLLPAFCNDPRRRYDITGFKHDFHKIHQVDAKDFLTGLDSGLIRPDGNMYSAPRSKAREQFFWEGPTKTAPRSITIWAKVIISVAALARLHFDLGWPGDLLGTQSSKYAFDVTAFHPNEPSNEYIACEVKKSVKETDALIQFMKSFGSDPALSASGGKEENAYKKILWLRARRAPIFWALGPDRSGTVFKVSYADDGRIMFEEAPLSTLRYPITTAT